MSVEDRMRAILERGWLVDVTSHPTGRLSALERDGLPGPWTIVYHVGEEAFCRGWEVTVTPAVRTIRTARRGYAGRRGGVYATLDQCLDEAEAYIAREEARTQ